MVKKSFSTKGKKEVLGLVQIACGYKSDIQIETAKKSVNAKSLFGVMQFSFEEHENITISANGEDESEAINRIEGYLST
ncbi:MAG: HPr family phosphocarrier protein [Lachnospiraceae bacterium]|nr:HPr family phosphocarrier protein [Muribaculum sp.]MCM1409896.1 HPr family phosphocarrier protein [Lachnospiraceae bacterium]